MLGAPARQRRMVSLGKVAAPKPINLPSQKKENNGNDPTVNLISKSGGWATGGATAGGGGGEDVTAGKQPERAIPAQPAPAWGGAGLPEERKKQVEIAAQQEYPIYEGPGRHAYDDDPRRRPWDADERGYSGPPPDGPPHRARYHYGPSSQDARFDTEFESRPPYDRYGHERGRYEGHYDRYDRFGDRDRYGPPPRHYGGYEDDYGPSRRGGYYDREREGGPPQHPHHGPEEREREAHGGPYGHPRGPPHGSYEREEPGFRRGGYRDERDWGEYPRCGRSPGPLPAAQPGAGPEHDGPAGLPAAGLDGQAAPAYGVRPPPPPPPRRAAPQSNGPSAEQLAAPQQQHQQQHQQPGGAPLERTGSLHSNASTQQSDSTLASSRLATLGSSMPRSEPGSLADAAELQQQRQQLEAASHVLPQAHAARGVLSPRVAVQQQQQQQQHGPAQPGYPQHQQPTRILKREPHANGVAQGHPQPGAVVNLPSQASLMDHLSSPAQQHALGMPAGGQPQGPLGPGMEAVARGMLPPQHGPLAPGLPMPGAGAPHLHPHLPPPAAPVTVIANFGVPAPPGQQQLQQQPALGMPSAAVHAGLVGHPQLAALEQQRQQQQQQHGAAPLVPASVPLMTFGPPQQLPAGHPQYGAVPLGAPGGMLPPQHAQQQPQAMMQFGAIQLPSAIDGSVDAEAPAGAAEQAAAGSAPTGAPLSAEAQHAYMKQKAAERARQLQQQQQQGGGRRQDANQRRPRVVPVVVAPPPPPPPPRSSAAQPAAPQAGGQRQGGRASRGGKAPVQSAAAVPVPPAVIAVKAPVPPPPALTRASSGSAAASEPGAAAAAGKPKRPRGGRKNKAAAAGEAATGAAAAAGAAAQAPAAAQAAQPAQPAPAAVRAGSEGEGKKRAVLVVPKRRPGAAGAAGAATMPAAEGPGPAPATAPPPGLGGKKGGSGGAKAPPGLSKGASSGAAAAVAAAAPTSAAALPASEAAPEANGTAAGPGGASKRKPRGSRGKGGKGTAPSPPHSASAAPDASQEGSKDASSAAAASAAGAGGESSAAGGGRGRGRGRIGRGETGGRGGRQSDLAGEGAAPAAAPVATSS
ncbi:hypothetical protein ABPG75_001540 [Micractinium tetrahymenae]